jgi:hypothetical protein
MQMQSNKGTIIMYDLTKKTIRGLKNRTIQCNIGYWCEFEILEQNKAEREVVTKQIFVK